MVRLSKSQFGRAIEARSVRAPEGHSVRSRPPSKRASKILITALIATLGIGAGWIGGKVINGRISRTPAAAPPSDPSIAEKPAPTPQPSESPQPAKRNSGAENAPNSRSESTAEVEEPLRAPEPPKEAASKEAPPKVPRVDKEEETDKTTAEDPSKEIGRKALKKMSKEIQKSKRDPANKNENDRDN